MLAGEADRFATSTGTMRGFELAWAAFSRCAAPAGSSESPAPMLGRTRNILGVLGLFAATLVVYHPVTKAGFIWNDAEYVTAPALRSVEGLARIWFELGATEQYYPLLHSAFWLEHRLWGDAPAGYHLINILLHATSACLLAAVLRRLAIPGAWFAGFLFALHPVCVESVAWISEQKNTLSLVFYLQAAWLYLQFDAGRNRRTYAIATLFFGGALLSKTTTAVLPPVLLVILWWQRGRLEWRREVRPLAPWLVAAAAMGIFSAWVERKFIGAEGAEFALSGVQRVLLAGRVAWFYLGKLLWPADLIFIYPRWEIEPAQLWQWLFPLSTLATLAGLWRWRARTRAPLAAALLFGGALFPVLGFFNVYAFLYSYVADHWQYLPCLAVLALLAAGIASGLRHAAPVVRAGLPAALVGALALLTFHQSRMYADLPTFYRTTLARNPACWMAHNNLGNLLRLEGRPEEAARHFRAALRQREDQPKVHYNLANTLRDLQRRDEALPHFQRALELQPNYPEALNSLGNLLRELGRPAAALPHLLQARRLDPDFVDVRNNLGMVLRELGRLPEALAQFEQAARADPGSAPVRLNLAYTLSLLGRDAEAAASYREARRLNPALPDLMP